MEATKQYLSSEMKALKNTVKNYDANGKDTLPSTTMWQQSREKQKDHNDIVDHLINQVAISKLST